MLTLPFATTCPSNATSNSVSVSTPGQNASLTFSGTAGGRVSMTVTNVTAANTEVYADGSKYCDRTYPYRPDLKVLGSYTLPLDILISGTYQFSRGVQNGGAGPAILASWSVASAQFAPTGTVGSTLGRALNAGSSTKTIALIREGLEYGDQNLHQLDLRASKRFRFNQYRMRIDFDLYNLLNSNWPYTVNTTFSNTATSAWLRPTNVLQSRFFKIGGQFDF